MLTRDMMHNYQNKGVNFVKSNKKVALWMQCGLGKSVTSLTAMSDLLDEVEVSKVLIIAPLRVANTTWHTELSNWEHLRSISYSICTGSAKDRVTELNKDRDVYIINREQIPWLVEYYGKKWPFDMVIIDESSSFKSPKAQRFKALKKVSKLIDRMVQLTGTPSPNGLMDIWAQIYLLDDGARLGRSMTSYKQCYFTSDYMGYKFTPLPDAQERIERKISDVVLTMKTVDYLELPDCLMLQSKVEMSAKHLKQYKTFEKEFVYELENSDEDISAFTSGALANKLLQFANGCIYDDEGNPVQIHDGKIDALRDIIESANGQPVLVAYNYKTDLERILSAFPEAQVLDKAGELVAKWNKGEVPILLAHPASASYGLNLQKGGNIMVWFGLTWSLEYYQQFNARLHRQGQTETVSIYHLVTSGTIDEKVMMAIDGKAETQDQLMEALKANL